jgi:hypothetical protein
VRSHLNSFLLFFLHCLRSPPFLPFPLLTSLYLGSIYDPVGMIVPSLKCIAWNGRVVVVGFAAGKIEQVGSLPLLFPLLICAHTLPTLQIPANLVLLKNIAVQGVHWVRIFAFFVVLSCLFPFSSSAPLPIYPVLTAALFL